MPTIAQHWDNQGHQVGCDTEYNWSVGWKVHPRRGSGPPKGKERALIKARGGEEGTISLRFDFCLLKP